MIPVLYPSTETEFTTNGLGRLTDCISFSVTEERNGVYEVEFVYPVTGIHYNDIEIGCIVYATHDALKEPEPFDIYKKSAPIEGRVTFYAHHVSYRLNEVVVRPFSMLGTAGEALNALKTNAVNTCGFTFFSDKATRLTYTVKQPDTLRHLLGGVQGSILDVYGSGDYEFKKFAVRLVTRGADRGVSIRYGKNMSDIKAVSNAEGTYNGVVPYWAQEDEIVTLPEWYITRSGVTDPILAPLDLTEEWTTAPTVEQLRAKATERLNNATPWVLDENIEVEFEPLEQTEDYADVAELQRVCIGDTVGIYYKAIGVSTKARVIKTVYSPLLEEYISVQVGDPQTTLADTIAERTENALAKKVVSPGYVAAAVNAATEKITGGLGGYVVIGKSANGTPEEILIMDTDDVQTAVNVIRMNRAGIGFSNTGYQGPFTSAWTIDGVFNTDYIVVNSLSVLSQNAGTITAGVLQSSDYQYTVGARYTTAGMIVDLDNKVIRTPRTAILADGSIYSTSVDLEGKINATSGSIGPWQISSTAIYNGLQSATGNDSGIYIGTNGIFGLSTDKTFRWYFNLGGNFYLEDLGTGTATTAILRMKKGTLQSRILPWGFNTYVDNESKSRIYLSSQNGTQRLELSNGTYTDVDICTTSTASYLYVGSPSDTGHGNVQLDAGSTYASVYICNQNRSSSVEINTSSPHIKIKSSTGTTSGWGSYNPQIVFQNANATKNGALIWNDTVQSPAALTLAGNQGGEYFIAPNIKATGAFYGSLTGHASLDLPLTGGTLSGTLTINGGPQSLIVQASDASERYMRVKNSVGNILLDVDASGNHGLYSSTKGGWLLYANSSENSTDNNLYIPRPLGTTGSVYVGGGVYVGNTTDTANRIVRCQNSVSAIELNCYAPTSTTYQQGLYDRKNGSWILYNSDANTVTIPRTLYCSIASGEAQVNASNGTHRIYLYSNSDGRSGIYAYNADGTGYAVIGIVNGATTGTFYGHSSQDLALSGGTLTGALRVASTVDANTVYVARIPGYTKGTAPSSEVSASVVFADKDGWQSNLADGVASVYGGVSSNGDHYVLLRAISPNTSTVDWRQFVIYYPKSGTPYASLNCTFTVSGTLTGYDYSGASHVMVGSAADASHRVGYLYHQNPTTVRVYGQGGGSGYTTYTTLTGTSSSDIRLKEHIKGTEVNALSLIRQIEMRAFDWKPGWRDYTHQPIGMIADQIEKLDNRLVIGGGYDPDGEPNYKVIDDHYLSCYLTKGIQELCAEIEQLKERIRRLEAA